MKETEEVYCRDCKQFHFDNWSSPYICKLYKSKDYIGKKNFYRCDFKNEYKNCKDYKPNIIKKIKNWIKNKSVKKTYIEIQPDKPWPRL